MKIEFNLTGNDRKELVKNISEIIGAPAEYQYMTTCAYNIGEHYTVTKDGMLIISDDADDKEICNLLSRLKQQGYSVASDNTRLTVQMPRNSLNERTLNRIRRILENKGELFKAASKLTALNFR